MQFDTKANYMGDDGSSEGDNEVVELTDVSIVVVVAQLPSMTKEEEEVDFVKKYK